MRSSPGKRGDDILGQEFLNHNFAVGLHIVGDIGRPERTLAESLPDGIAPLEYFSWR